VGAVAYELFSGYPPFMRELGSFANDAIRADYIDRGMTPAPITKWDERLPSDLAELIDRTLIKEPALRVDDAKEPEALTVLRDRWRDLSQRHGALKDLPLSPEFRPPGPEFSDDYPYTTEQGE
jgi:serine/threonine protein kinase